MRDPFVRRVLLALTLTAVGLGVTPVISDLGVRPADGAGTFARLALALTLFGLFYGAILAVSVLWALLPSRAEAH